MRRACPSLQPGLDPPSCLDEIGSRKDEFEGLGEERHRFEEMTTVVNLSLSGASVDVMVPTFDGLFKYQK